MKARIGMLAIAAALLALAAPANAVDLHGYFRNTIGGNAKGGNYAVLDSASPFGTANHLRLANEGNYSEFELSQLVLKDKNGVEWSAGFMFGWDVGTADPQGANLKNHLDELFVKGTLPQLNGASVWAGNRYYHRIANDIYDYFYVNESNPGVGIENYDVGFGKINVAVFRHQPNLSTSTPGAVAPNNVVTFWYPDIRLEAIPVNPGGALDIGVLAKFRTWNKDLNGGVDKPDKTQSFSPFLFVKHSQSGIMDGGNNFAITYKTGCFINDDCQEDRRRITVTDDLLLQPTKEFSVVLAGVFVNEQANAGTLGKATGNGYSIGVRPIFKVSDHFAIQADAGYFYNKINKGTDAEKKANSFIKASLAPTITPFTDGFAWGVRPEIRFFVTYASWNKEQAFNGAGSAQQPQTGKVDAKNGTMFGSQLETWF